MRLIIWSELIYFYIQTTMPFRFFNPIRESPDTMLVDDCRAGIGAEAKCVSLEL